MLTALKQTEGFCDSVEIRTDSIYVVRAVNDWCNKWECNGWRNAKGQPVANQDIFQEILEYKANRRGPVYVHYVPGHSNVYGNERADELAGRGALMD